MAQYRKNLPQLSGDLFATVGGFGTTLIFQENIDLPHFASFIVLQNESGKEWLQNFERRFIDIAQEHQLGIILQSPTWRCNPDWINKLNLSHEDFVYLNKLSIELLEQLRNEYPSSQYPIVISASVGPRSDAYKHAAIPMTPHEAQQYHSQQIEILSQTNVDLIVGFTLNSINEAIGIVRAAQQFRMPVAISFTVETDGNLISGQSLKEAIEIVDRETENEPVYYMINCSHPVHIQKIFENQQSKDEWMHRIQGIHGNASKKSHQELDQCTELDDGNPHEYAQDIGQLLYQFPNLNILGGCCGTDIRHMKQICQHCQPIFNQIKNNKF